MKKMLRQIKRLLDKTFGTIIDEFYWRFRGKSWAKKYLTPESINHPHRQLLIEHIAIYAPFESALEVGCASGANLYLIAKRFPTVKLYGTDINKRAVYIGREWFATQGINCSFSTHKAEDLKQFPDKSIDIIFTDAALIYVGPEKIERVIKEFARVAKKALIFNEWHDESQNSIYNDHWIHNYRTLLKKFTSEDNIRFTKIPQELWGGDWAKYGYIIEVKI